MTDSPPKPNEEITGFYSGSKPDAHGRYLREIQSWPDDALEYVHNFIQWLFPLTDPSPVNPRAPVLDRETISAFRSRPDLQQNLRTSFERMLRFYGFQPVPGSPARLERSPNFDDRASNWLSAGNHNHLRITRIIKCLRLLGFELEAKAFFDTLAEIYAVEKKKPRPAISSTTFRFWVSAARDPV